MRERGLMGLCVAERTSIGFDSARKVEARFRKGESVVELGNDDGDDEKLSSLTGVLDADLCLPRLEFLDGGEVDIGKESKSTEGFLGVMSRAADDLGLVFSSEFFLGEDAEWYKKKSKYLPVAPPEYNSFQCRQFHPAVPPVAQEHCGQRQKI